MASEKKEQWLDVIVRRVQDDAAGVLVVELEHPRGLNLPSYEPGAHIALKCGLDLVRHYSLCGPMEGHKFYRLGIKIEPNGKGGTKWVRENARLGETWHISSPRNNFPLVQDKESYLFISAGIGITPILPMLEALHRQRKKARLIHLCRAPDELSFSTAIQSLAGFHDVHLHFDSIKGELYDITSEIQRTPEDAVVYCCGPAPLMHAVRECCRQYGREENLHLEFFQSEHKTDNSDAGSFIVELNSTGREIRVGSNESILSALRNAGISIESECEEGVCGTCAVKVISGLPDHRDFFLSDAERQGGQILLTCVSRSKSSRLVVDL